MKYTINKNNYLKIIIISIIAISICLLSYFFFNKKNDIQIDILDTSSSISENIDDFIKNNTEKPGVHTLRQDGYTYLLIVSDKERATEISINLYNIYKHRFKINVEYEVEVNKDTISLSNPEKIQTMLIRFKEFGKIKPVKMNGK